MNKFSNLKIHLVGVGGSGMCAICNLLIDKGFSVSGSDLNKNEVIETLIDKGLKFYNFHKEFAVENSDIVVYSSAIKSDNVELIRAKELRKAIYSRSQLLQTIINCYKKSVGVSGCHGKTTASSMLCNILTYSGVETAMIIGGLDNNLGLGVNCKTSKNLVCEVCEYNRNISGIKTYASVCLNVDNDHLDCYESVQDIKKEYFNFLNRAKYKFINADDEFLKEYLTKNTYTFGVFNNAYFKAENVKSINGKYCFDLYENDNYVTKIALSVYGKHNVYNALSAIAVARKIYNLSYKNIALGLSKFCGNKRRFEFLFTKFNKNFIADYAHHPTEIKSTIQLCKELFIKDYLIVFQPHTYSRTKLLFNEFLQVLNGENAVIYKEYPAREKLIENATAKDLSLAIKGSKYASNVNELVVLIKKSKKTNVLVLGAGNLYDEIKNAE